MSVKSGIAVALGLSLPLAWAGVPAARAADTVRVGLAAVYPAYSIPYAAIELGFYKEKNLDVDITLFRGGPATQEALASGAIDVSTIVFFESLIAQSDLVSVAPSTLLGARAGVDLNALQTDFVFPPEQVGMAFREHSTLLPGARAVIDVLVLGDLNPDLVLRGDVVPRFGQAEQLLDAATLVLGGSAAITAHTVEFPNH